MPDLLTHLSTRLERRLRECEQKNLERVTGTSPQTAYQQGIKAAIACLQDVFQNKDERLELQTALLCEANKIKNAMPHPRTRSYRSEPESWNIEESTAERILASCLSRIEKATQPAVVFDLDGTLFDVSNRTLGILKEWLLSNDARKFPRTLVRHLEDMSYCHMGYSMAHAFENAGLDLRNQDVSELLDATERHWRKRFFDGKTLVDLDDVLPGAREFVQIIQDAGAHICYLTGRDHRGMHAGTVKQLEKHGFPLQNITLLLKNNHEQEDHEYKKEAFAGVAKKWQVIANFENEYINIWHMAQTCPTALHVVVDTQHSGRPVPRLDLPIARLTDFAIPQRKAWE
jgi:hypothetical protein